MQLNDYQKIQYGTEYNKLSIASENIIDKTESPLKALITRIFEVCYDISTQSVEWAFEKIDITEENITEAATWDADLKLVLINCIKLIKLNIQRAGSHTIEIKECDRLLSLLKNLESNA